MISAFFVYSIGFFHETVQKESWIKIKNLIQVINKKISSSASISIPFFCNKSLIISILPIATAECKAVFLLTIKNEFD